MQQFSNHSNTIVSQTSLDAVLGEIRDGVSYPDFWTDRYGDDQGEQQLPVEQQQESGVEVKR